ncbi:glycosyltransferase [Shewanella sp. GXUN23E]|uniref:glycosyltransferase n=1 Tax=Shewanella sp. GXUN23E TaxID=3422498 RepID=UPI003D7D4FD9
MERVLILTIRAKGGGAEKIIEQLVSSCHETFDWVNMESLLHYSIFLRYVKFIILVYSKIKFADKVIIGTEGILGLVILPFKIIYRKKKFILWNHCYFEEYKKFLSFKNRLLYKASYTSYPRRINSSPVSQKGVFIPNPFEFKKNVSKNAFITGKSITLLSISSLAKLKRVDFTLDLLAKLPNNFKLNIYGDGIEKEFLEYKVKNINIENRVTFFGFVKSPFSIERDEARILVINSKTEALPTIILEAIDNGVPVIVNTYAGSDYWRDFKSVFVVDTITSEKVVELSQLFNKMNEEDYCNLFYADINKLEVQHSYEKFIERLFYMQ